MVKTARAPPWKCSDLLGIARLQVFARGRFMPNKNILLIEPGYKNKYPPLGLMKIAAYHGPHGKKDNVKFIKGERDLSVLNVAWDRIYVTTLFSFEWKTIAKSINFALRAAHNQPAKVFVGGIAAS